MLFNFRAKYHISSRITLPLRLLNLPFGIAALIDTSTLQMVSSLRHILVMTLLLLQIAAPLVHAHVGIRSGSDGLHLHEFESLVASHHDTYVQSAEYRMDAGIAVTIGQAIKSQLSDSEWMPAIILPTDYVLPTVYQAVCIIRYDDRTWFKFVNPVQKHNLTRAPPSDC